MTLTQGQYQGHRIGPDDFLFDYVIQLPMDRFP